MECIINGNRGIYLPQAFISSYRNNIKQGTIDQDDIDILEDGPEDEYYWDVWEDILDNAIVLIDGKEYSLYQKYSLYQDGDLFIVAEGEEISE